MEFVNNLSSSIENSLHLRGLDECACSDGCDIVTMSITLDDWPYETSFTLTDTQDQTDVWAMDSDSLAMTPGEVQEYDRSICKTKCYKFVIEDSWGDGICCWYGNGEYVLTINRDDLDPNMWSGGQFSSSESFFVGGGCTGDEHINANDEFGDDDCDESTESCSTVKLELKTDNYPTETSFSLENTESGFKVWELAKNSLTEMNQVEQYNGMIKSSSCYRFLIEDSWGDGICCGYGDGNYKLTVDDEVVVQGGNFQCYDVYYFGDGCDGGEEDSFEYQTDGSCWYTPPDYDYTPPPDYDYTLPPNDNIVVEESICGDLCPDACVEVSLSITLDMYPGETSFSLIEADDPTAVAWNVNNVYSDSEYASSICTTKCYEFLIEDSWGDGICCSAGDGNYVLTVDGVEVRDGGDFGCYDVYYFGDGCGGSEEDSFEYQNDGSCWYIPPDYDYTPPPDYDNTPPPEYDNIVEESICGDLCPDACVEVSLSITLDMYPGETSFSLIEADDPTAVAWNVNNVYSDSEYTSSICTTKCYEFLIEDSYGDGICCSAGDGNYVLTVDGAEVRDGGDFGCYDVYYFGDGCGGSEEDNFEYQSDGYCWDNNNTPPPDYDDYDDYEFTLPPIGEETSQDDCNDDCSGECAEIKMTITSDSFPSETSFSLINTGTNFEVWVVDGLNDSDAVFSYTNNICRTNCYQFEIEDSYGDGICCGYGLGSYVITVDDEVVAEGGEFDDYEEHTIFC